MGKKTKGEVSAEVLDANIDKTLVKDYSSFRKPRGIFSYEFSFIFNGEMSFGSSIYKSLLKAFSKVFDWKGLPDDIRSEEMEMFLIQSGRLKFIKVGERNFVVHIVPKKFNNYGDWIESTIIEPYLPALSGKTTEKFKNVEIKNDVLGHSLIRLVYPFISTIDDTLFNLENNQAILAGKYIFVDDKASNKDDNTEQDNALSQWMIDGKPVKTLSLSLMDDGTIPLKIIEVNDATQSFIETIQFNYSQMLNVLGIPNNNVEGKKERLITSEINIQNVLQASIIDDMLSMRKRAAKQLKEVFGWDVSVELRQDIKAAVEQEQEQEQEGDNDES